MSAADTKNPDRLLGRGSLLGERGCPMRQGEAVMAVICRLVKPLRGAGRIADPNANPAYHPIALALALLIRN